MLRNEPEQALAGIMAKNQIAILKMTDNISIRTPTMDQVDKQITPAINYLILLEAMLMEDTLEMPEYKQAVLRERKK
jgi:hypothetical protein